MVNAMRSLVFLRTTALPGQTTTAEDLERREELSPSRPPSEGLLVSSVDFVGADAAVSNHIRQVRKFSGGAQLNPVRPAGGDVHGQPRKRRHMVQCRF